MTQQQNDVTEVEQVYASRLAQATDELIRAQVLCQQLSAEVTRLREAATATAAEADESP